MLGDVAFRAFCQQTVAETDTASADQDDVESLLLMYKIQVNQFKEDFEHEVKDHQRTKAQVESLMIQWKRLYDELRQCRAEVCDGTGLL